MGWITAFDVGFSNLAFVTVVGGKAIYARRIDLHKFPKPNLGQRLREVLSTFAAELSEDVILIEQQPLQGLQSVQQLLIYCCQLKHGAWRPSPRAASALRRGGVGLRAAEDLYRAASEPHLRHLEGYRKEMQHDMADAYCMIEYHASKPTTT